jgi:serine/threonine protein kinase
MVFATAEPEDDSAAETARDEEDVWGAETAVRKAVSPPAGPGSLAPAEGPDELGRLGPYRLLRALGQGGMGVVYKAEDTQLHRQVALKVLLPEHALNPVARQRFLREAQAAAAVEHEHIIPVYQVGEDRGLPYLAMPLLRGETLAERLKREPILSLGEVLQIGRQTAQGLAAAHQRGLIHRDIKPANIWLEQLDAAGRFSVKILDFGLARPADWRADKPLTQLGFVLGTPGYMSPEQAAGEKIDCRSDLFSLGVLLYRMCTGEQPFAGATSVAVLSALALLQPCLPRDINPDIPEALQSLILRLLAKDPTERTPDGATVVEEVQRIESDVAQRVASAPAALSPVVSQEPEMQPLAQRPGARPPGRSYLWPVLGGMVLLASVGVAGLIWLRGSTHQQERDRQESKGGGREGSARPTRATSFVPTSIRLYYGTDPGYLGSLARGLKKGQVLVIDLRTLPVLQRKRLLKEADRVGAKVLSYLSVSELQDERKEAFRAFASAQPGKREAGSGHSLDDLVVARNVLFKADRMDVLADLWRAWVLAEADKALATGVHGLFLDTVDTVDVYSTKKDWKLARRAQSVEAMIRLVRDVKAMRQRPYVLMNRGLNLIGAKVFVGDDSGVLVPGLDLANGHEHNPDGILWENAFSSRDAWSLRVDKELRGLSKSGKVAVFALAYRKTLGEPAAFFRTCVEAGFIPAWATSSTDLHNEPTVGPPSP